MLSCGLSAHAIELQRCPRYQFGLAQPPKRYRTKRQKRQKRHCIEKSLQLGLWWDRYYFTCNWQKAAGINLPMHITFSPTLQNSFLSEPRTETRIRRCLPVLTALTRSKIVQKSKPSRFSPHAFEVTKGLPTYELRAITVLTVPITAKAQRRKRSFGRLDLWRSLWSVLWSVLWPIWSFLWSPGLRNFFQLRLFNFHPETGRRAGAQGSVALCPVTCFRKQGVSHESCWVMLSHAESCWVMSFCCYGRMAHVIWMLC